MGKTAPKQRQKAEAVQLEATIHRSWRLTVFVTAIALAAAWLVGGQTQHTSPISTPPQKKVDRQLSALTKSWSTRWSIPNTTEDEIVGRQVLSLHPRIELDTNFLDDKAVAQLLSMHHDDDSGYLNDDGEKTHT